MSATRSEDISDDVTPGLHGVERSEFSSSPSVLSLSSAVGHDQFTVAMAASNDVLIPANLSLYTHIPFCRSLCYYCGCNKKVTRNAAVVNRYMTALHREIRQRATEVDDDRMVDQLHWGGGTPTYLNAGQRESLMRCFRQHFVLSKSAERDFSIELDPRTIGPEEIVELCALGFNRVSIAVQDFSPRVQAAINRMCEPDRVLSIVAAARTAAIGSIGIDLICGLPEQTQRSFGNTLERVIEMRPDTLNVLQFAYAPARFAAQRLLDRRHFPATDTQRAMFFTAMRRLVAVGYEFIGMGLFALPGSVVVNARRNRRLQRGLHGYVAGAGNDILGFGASAMSQVGGSFFQAHTEIPDYVGAVMAGRTAIAAGRVATADDRRVSHVIQSLMCYGRCNKFDWNIRFRANFDGYFADALRRLEPFKHDEMIVCRKNHLRITSKGRLYLQAITRCFDRDPIQGLHGASAIV